MSNKVLVHCKNTDQIIEINEGDSLLQIYGQSGVELPYQVLCARVNNKTEDLDYRVFRPKDIEFIDASHPSGMRTYVRSLCFVFYKALEDVMPGARLRIEHSISKGYFCGINNRQEISQETTNRIKARMRKIIADNLPFQRIECKTSDAIKLFQEQNLLDKVDLLETSKSLYTTFYRLDNLIDYYYSCLVPSTGYLNLFDLIKYDGGLLLVPPSAENPSVMGTVVKQDKMLAAFKEYIHFNSIIGLNNVGDLNLAIENRQATDLIKVSEALHEKKISNIADEITRRNRDGEGARIILISGPSSSGKTTFSKRLAIQLMTNLIRPVTISLDNYFVEREETPLDENGEYDYESLYALDLELFNNDINRLLKGEEIDLPTYNFETGKKIYRGNKLRLKESEEGIHRKRLQMPSVSPVLHTQDTSQTRDCRTYTNYVHWQIILTYHWTTWWEETGNRKKITKGGTLRSNHSRNVYQLGVNPPADIASGRAHIVRWTMVLRRPKRSVDLQRCAVEVCHAIA